MYKATTTLIGWITLLSLLFLGGCAEPPYTNLSNQQLKELMAKNVPLIDIRTPREWKETGTIPGSHKITFFEDSGKVNPQFFRRLETLLQNTTDPVALICRSGNRTAALGKILVNEVGYQNVYNVQHGINSWISSQNPIKR